MFNTLKNHPFAVEAFFETSLVLTFAAPKEELQGKIPKCLQLDVFDQKWAFVAVALVQTRGLRPKGFPRFMGNDFFLAGFRVFVRYTNKAGKNLRGLYILKSATNKKMMEIMGNFFTHYNYTTTDITQSNEQSITTIQSKKDNFLIKMDSSAEPAGLPKGSPFKDWAEARRFAGPLPFTFTYNRKNNEVLIIEGVRQDWKPEPVNILHHHISFIENLNITDIHLANAFLIENIPYYWKKGKLEKWNN